MLQISSARMMGRVCAHLPSIGTFNSIRGSFSAFEQLEQGVLEGKIIFPLQAPGPCPEGSMTERSGMNQNGHQPWPIFWVRTDDARLIGDILRWRDANNRICSDSDFKIQKRVKFKIGTLFLDLFVPKPLILPGAWTSIVSSWGNGSNYYHWMLDCLTRLMVRESLPEHTRILIPQSNHPFVQETLEMLSVDADSVAFTEKCLQPERYYCCSPAAMTGVWNPLGYEWLKTKFSAFMQTANSGKSVFFTRRGGTRVPPNLAKIEKTFGDAGFSIIDCGALTVKKQIEIASSATAIAGIHGAAMTNLLWSSTRTPVMEIFDPDFLNACYEQIAFHNNLKYSHLMQDDPNISSKILNWVNNALP